MDNKNVYFQARKSASAYNDSLSSRDGAAEKLGISSETLKNYELGITKVIPVDRVVEMAELYNAPELITRYCVEECPVHGFLPLSVEPKGIQGVTLKLLKTFNTKEVEELKDSLLDVMEDGVITSDEVEKAEEILVKLDEVAHAISEMKIAAEKAIRKGN